MIKLQSRAQILDEIVKKRGYWSIGPRCRQFLDEYGMSLVSGVWERSAARNHK